MALGRCARGVLLVLSLLLARTAFAAPHVLLLNSYHSQYPWAAALTEGVADLLAPSIGDENLHVEYLDGRRMVGDNSYFQALAALLRIKYRQFHPDVIITSDDYALEFMLAWGDQLFPGVPVVFCGINVLQPEQLTGRTLYTGLLEGMEIEGNLDLIMALRPGTRRIVMLADRTEFGVLMARHAREVMQQRAEGRWQPRVTLELWDNFTFNALQRQLSELPQNAAVLMLAIHKDAGGRYFSFGSDLPVLTSLSPAPMFGMWGGLMLGTGIVGGMMNNPYQHGRSAASMAQQILAGTPPWELPMIDKATYRPYFDARALERFGILRSRLPVDSTVAFEPEQGFWQRYQWQIMATLLVLLGLLVTVVVLTINIHRRRKAEQVLRHWNQELDGKVRARTADLEDQAKQLAHLSHEMHTLAYTDTLTGLPNRRAGQEWLEQLLAGADTEPLSVALLDLDHFKQINDRFGHAVGDAVIAEAALRVRDALRPDDQVFRWGGEEFLLVLPATAAVNALKVAERVREQLQHPSGTAARQVTASIGVASRRPGDAADALLLRADERLYEAKDSGRNRVVGGAD